MPELPEAEVVRRGMAAWTAGARAGELEVLDTRALRRTPGGPDALVERLRGAVLEEPQRRGKFLWIPVRARPADPAADTLADAPADAPAAADEAVVVHLGMSGQVRVDAPDAPAQRHLRLRLPITGPAGPGRELRFVDQRLFGGWWQDALVTDPATGRRVPASAAHIAPDPLEEGFDVDAVHRALVRRRSTLKRALLDQSLVSGIGNIYADEALWAARLHPERPTQRMTRAQTREVLGAVQEIMARALEAGGTSFDALYVNVDGRSGEHARSLQAYGRTGQPCRRCAAQGVDARIVREPFMGRASHRCPRCQPRPRGTARA